jgi:hypothetical protein
MKFLAALTFALSALGLASATKCCADKSVRIPLKDMSLILYSNQQFIGSALVNVSLLRGWRASLSLVRCKSPSHARVTLRHEKSITSRRGGYNC